MTEDPTVRTVSYRHPDPMDDAAMVERANEHRDFMAKRRSVRTFDSRPVPMDVIRAAIEAAGSAPSGANHQPWHFVVVSDPEVKSRIRKAAEAEERTFYAERAPEAWLQALAPLGTDENKPFLEEAPHLIVVFAERYGVGPAGFRKKNYYVQESVGIATGMLIAALHHAGLSTLTHTPSPMRFLRDILDRPEQEQPYLVLVVGHAAEGTEVPDIKRKAFEQIATLR